MSLVSVIIPTYNGGKHLLEAVDSALQQTYDSLEIIVVDDGSQEDILGILAPVSQRIKYVRQENAGPAVARNRGITEARGEFIAFLDDDDLWHPRKIEAQMRTMSENPDCGLVYSYPILIDNNGVMIDKQRPMALPSGHVYYDFVKKCHVVTPSATIIRSSVFVRSGVFDSRKECISSEDCDLWARIARYFSVYVCSDAIVYYRQTKSGISNRHYNHLLSNLYIIHKWIREYNHDDIHEYKKFIDAIADKCYSTYRIFAYRLYYDYNDRVGARILLAAALRKNPRNLTDIIFLIMCSLPKTLFLYIRNIKRRLSGLKRD
jgi:glycosyltransferase involved in cell wall biosynthesis